ESPTLQLRRPSEFFAEAESEYRASGNIPTWRGELYLELHRSTFTSQLATKQGNRRTEALLRTVEYLAAYAAVTTGAPYPHAELDEIWQTTLLHQFHDILPGSSIAWVHREARATYADLEERLRALAARATDALGTHADSAQPRRLAPTAAGTWAEAPTTSAPAPAAGTEAPTTGRQTVSLSATGENLTVGPQTPLVLDNEALRAEFNSAGHVRSLRDLAGDRELLPAGQALGVVTLFRDQPVMGDAWGVDRHVLQMPKPLNRVENITATTGEDGSASVRATYTDGTSTFTLTYTLRPGAAELEMGAEVDWYTREHLLKVNLPVEVRAEHAAY